jgi:hypothetical protein
MRVWAVNGTSSASARSRSRRGRTALGQVHDRAPSGVSSARLDSQHRLGQLGVGHPADREELGGHAVAVGDGAGLVEQQRGHVAGGLDGSARHGQHVALHEAVHAGDADGREQPADGGGDQAHQQGDEDHDRLLAAGVDGEGLQGDRGQQEDDGETRQQDVEGDLVGGLLPLGPLDQGDHPVDERLAGLLGDRTTISSDSTRCRR